MQQKKRLKNKDLQKSFVKKLLTYTTNKILTKNQRKI